MIISCNELGLNITIDDYNSLVVVVEKHSNFVQLISAVRQTIDNTKECIVVTENEKKLNLSKEAIAIIDLWNIDCNSKQIKNKLYQLMLDVSNEQLDDRFIGLRTDLFRYIENISDHIPYDISYNMQLDPLSIFKCIDVEINTVGENLMEQLVEYMKLLQSLCKVKIIFFVNMKTFFSKEEIELLYKEAYYINIQLVLIEHSVMEYLRNEKIVIIDQDDCIINI